MTEICIDDYGAKCPKCGSDWYMVIDDDLQQHNLEKKEAYQLVHCDKCCTYYKVVWKLEKIVMMKDIDNDKVEAGQWARDIG